MDKEAIETIAQNICSCCFYQHPDCPFPLEKPCQAARHFAEELLAELTSLGLVQLDLNQRLPVQAHYLSEMGKFSDTERRAYKRAQQDMLTPKNGTVWAKIKCPDAGFRKVKK